MVEIWSLLLHDLIIFAFASNTVWQRVNGIKRTRSLVELVFAAATGNISLAVSFVLCIYFCFSLPQTRHWSPKELVGFFFAPLNIHWSPNLSLQVHFCAVLTSQTSKDMQSNSGQGSTAPQNQQHIEFIEFPCNICYI